MRGTVYIQRRLFHNKSFLMRFISSYLCILLIPTVTIFFTYFTAESSIRREVLQNNEITLNRIFDLFDERLSGIGRLAMLVESETAVSIEEDRAQGSLSSFTRYQVQKYLASLYRDDVEDIFLFFRSSDMMVSGMGASASSRVYYEYYYQPDSEGMSYEEWMELFGGRVNKDLRVIYTASGQRTLAYVQPLPFGNLKKSSADVCFVLKPSLVRTLLEDSIAGGVGGVSVFDRNRALMLTSDERYVSEEIAENLDRTGLYYTKVNGTECAVQVFPSSVLSCYYVSAVPVQSFWARLNTLRLICTVSILFCMVVSVFLSILLARRNYHPVSNLVGDISRHTKLLYNRAQENEVDFIKNAVERVVKEKDALSLRLENGSSQLREGFLFQTLQGVAEDREDFRSLFSANGITLLSDAFCVLLLNMEEWDTQITGDDSTAEGSKRMTFIIQNVLGEIFSEGQGHQCFVLRLDRRRFAGVVNLGEGSSREQIRILCEQAREGFSRYLSIECSLCVGPDQQGLAGIHRSYTGALAALDYLFVFGIKRTVLYEQIGERVFQYNYSFRALAEREITLYLQPEGPSKDETALVDAIVQEAIDVENSSLEAFKCFQYDAVSLLNRIAGTSYPAAYLQQSGFMDPLISADTFEDFRTGFAYALRTLKSMGTNESSDPACSIREYIDRHFSDPQLNVNKLGESMGLSPSYASKIFKTHYGISPLEYIGKARISHAKALLITTRESIDNVSAQSGFLSSSVFIRTFKKEEGLTPGNYRNLHSRT